MLQVILHTIIISVICMLWGLPAFLLCQRYKAAEKWMGEGLPLLVFLFFSGLLTISFISSWLILFIALKFSLLLMCTGLMLIFIAKPVIAYKQKLLFFLKHKITYNPILIIFCSVVILLLLIMGVLKPINGDTQIYHLQIIRWTNEYGIVPGLANIFPRLGLGSNWFNLISFFHIPAFTHQNFTYLNVTVTIWFLLWLITKLQHFSRNEISTNNKPLLVFYFLITFYFLAEWQLFRDTANSTAYDFIVTILIIFCLSNWVEKLFFIDNQLPSTVLIFLSFSIITFKLSGLLILVFIILLILNSTQRFKLFLFSSITSLLIVLPVLIKNHITTGYFLFPYPFTIGYPDWRLPETMTAEFKNYIINVNRYYNYQLSFINTLDKTTFNWIPYWINGILIQHRILIVLSFFSFSLLFINKSKKFIDLRFLKLLLLVLWVMLLGWFFSAPDPRFIYGVLLISSFLPLAIWSANIKLPITYSLLITVFITIFYLYFKMTILFQHTEYLIYPVANDQPVYQKLNNNGIVYYKPGKMNSDWNCKCYYTPIPCITEENPFLAPRGFSIKKGFKYTTTPDIKFVKNYNY